jgi:hypothetical protein
VKQLGLGQARKSKKNPKAKGKLAYTRWVWGACELRPDGSRKRFAFTVLDHCAAKPRGIEAIRKCISEHVAPGSFVVSDEWRGTVHIDFKTEFDCGSASVNHSKDLVVNGYRFGLF